VSYSAAVDSNRYPQCYSSNIHTERDLDRCAYVLAVSVRVTPVCMLQAALKDKILSEELEFEELLKADDDGDGDVSQSEYILYKLEQVLLIVLLVLLY
jgi:hypothetical protein